MFELSIRRLCVWTLTLLMIPVGVQADPPPANPFPTPPPRVFCFRVTDIEAVSGAADRFRFQFEMLNWTNQPASGAYIWLNEGSYGANGAAPAIVDAFIDPDGRGGPPGGEQIGEGNYNVPAHHSGRGRGDIPGHRNDWDTVFVGSTSVFWGDDGQGAAATPIPPRSILTAANSAGQFALVPGLGEDGLGIGDAAIDGGPLPYGTPTQPAPFPAGGQPSPDGSGNVLDGFVVEVDDFHVGDVLSFNWMLVDASGDSIGSVGSGGNTVGNEMGFGVFNVSRVAPGAALPPGPFSGNSGFNQDIRSFYSGIYEVPDEVLPSGPPAAEFGVEFGAAILAQPASPNVATEVPGTVTVTVPDLTTVVPNAEPMPCTIPSPLGDANDSGIINVADLVCQLLVTLWEAAASAGDAPECLAVPLTHVDLNCDGARTVQDVVLNTYVVLYEAFPDSVDGNGNTCPDTCDCSEAACDDGNACTVDQCDLTGGCTNTLVTCNDGDPCTFDLCQPATGCAYAPVGCAGAEGCFILEGATCDDGDTCTTDDGCFGGTCTGTAISCDDGNDCTTDTCDPGTGCVNTALANGAACGGGSEVCVEGECIVPSGCTSAAQCPTDACTTYDCQPAAGFGSNQCVIVSRTNCNDGSPCTDDSCNPASGCEYAANDAADCDDGDICTLNDTCTGGACVSDPNLCDDDNDCTTDFCDPVTGCWAIALDGVGCDDGSACTTGDTCEVGFCVGTDVVCTDGDVCTVDSCDPASGCDYAASPCEDGDPCTGDNCDPTTGCDFAPLSVGTCDDGEVCTINDSCQAGVCTGTELTGCGPGTPTVCAVWGNAGDTVYCPIRVAALDSGLPATAAFQASFTYPNSTATFLAVNDGQFCAPSEANCNQTLDWNIPDISSALQSGHGVSLNPVDPSSWAGGGTVLALHATTPTALLTNATVENNMLLGDPLLFSLVFQLDENVSENAPMLVSASGVSAVSPDIVELAVYFDDAVILTGSGDGTIPVTAPANAVAGESYDFANAFTCPPDHTCEVSYSSPGVSGSTTAGPEGTSHASMPLGEGAGSFTVAITPSGGGTPIVIAGPAFAVAAPSSLAFGTPPTDLEVGDTLDFATLFTCPVTYTCAVSYATPGVSETTTTGAEGTSHVSVALTEGAGTFSVELTPTAGGGPTVISGPAFTVSAPAVPPVVGDTLVWDGTTDDLSDWNSLVNVYFDNLVVEEVYNSSSLYFTDASPFYHAYAASVDFDPTVEATASYHIQGNSMEESALYVFWEDDTGAFHNVECADAFGVDLALYDANEQALIPYTCPSNDENWVWDETEVAPPSGVTVRRLHFRIFVGASPGGDWTRVYRFGVQEGDVAIEDNAGVFSWSDGTLSASCDAYRNPGAGYVAATADGLYQIDPDNNGTGTTAYCDQTTDGGGWTVVLNVNRGHNQAFAGDYSDFIFAGQDTVNPPTTTMPGGRLHALSNMTFSEVAALSIDSGPFASGCKWNVGSTAGFALDDCNYALKTDGSPFLSLQTPANDCYIANHGFTGTVRNYASAGASATNVSTHTNWDIFGISDDGLTANGTEFGASTYAVMALDNFNPLYFNSENCRTGTATNFDSFVIGVRGFGDPVPACTTGTITPLGSGATCKTILDANPSAVTGFYTVDPDGAGGVAPFVAHCEMDLQGGGWTQYASHADGLTIAVQEPVRCDGVVNDAQWISLRDSMVDGMMFIDENDLVSQISSAKLHAGACVSIDEIPSLLNSPNTGRLWYHEDAACDAVGSDYSQLYLSPAAVYGASLYQLSSLKFDVWPYPVDFSYNLQHELRYYVR